ncbi:integral membrane sensor signal transduction histidine kinase [Alkaliphilus metalliredigens QYMF]|uniref:histidine kinase n=1 Tax=Alkaliphilus metalliredigens (strain QYMF) TaxID=293826 RepID=A6TPG4_ALKMQ|nr:HAMP domain-containing sensor histidine kinase [Alkaliphilus metalliredigens]ABR48082.1 integral membrane sensor signal transduction histidine kinase [Alkaliphilus metalliredigens QYMF]
MKKRMSLAVSLVVFVFFVMVLSVVIGRLCTYLLSFVFDGRILENGLLGFFALLLTSTFIGTSITALLSRWMVKPVRNLIEAIEDVAKGDFGVSVKGSNIPELESLAASFNKMARELAGIEMLRTDFINNFSHEFKTPIVSIKGFAKLLKEDGLTSEEAQEYLDIIIQESQRLADLSTNVLNLSKVQSTEVIREKEIYALDEQIRQAILILEPKWSTKNLSVDVDLESININNNAPLLQQIWVNLLDNAIKFTDNGGKLQVSLRRINSSIRFCLRDNGHGMDEETKQHIFDKFYQGDTSHAIIGNGLGLTLVKKIVILCNGHIEVESSLGKGSAFIVFLPSGMSMDNMRS